MSKIAVSCLCLLAYTVTGWAGSVTVNTDAGAVRGKLDDGLAVYKGIPYASAPVGEWRWRPPQPVEPWSDIREAAVSGHACPQPLGKYPAWADSTILAAGINEDCLNLNIWAPAHADGLPVMFYMHGGNMQFGANAMPIYNGNELARDGIVLVVINYRLGYLGRFGHPALTRLQSGEALINYGLQDQIAALEWVQRNISAFGGDPENVTIFGHSAGGVSVNTLMTTPQSAGLFHKAIAQGSAIQIDRLQHGFESLARGVTGQSSERVGEEFAEHFSVTGNTDEGVVAGLRDLSWEAIVEYQEARQKPFNPVVDGQVVVENTAEVFERGGQHNVPYLTGANSWESGQIENIPLIGRWFLGGSLIEGLSEEDLAPFDDQWTRIGLSQRWFAEGLFLTSTRYLAGQMSTVSSPAWLYHVTYQQSAIRGQVPGAAHGVEMPAIFGGLEAHPEYQRPQAAAAFPPSKEDLVWAHTVQRYWLNFAKTGNPNGPRVPEWPEYHTDTDLTQDLGEEIMPRTHLYKDTLDYLQERALIRRAAYDEMDTE